MHYMTPSHINRRKRQNKMSNFL